MRIGKSADAAIERADVLIDVVSASEAHDRLHDCHHIARAVIDFFSQQDLPFFGPLAIRDVGGNAAEPDQPASLVEARRCRARAPAYFAVRPPHAKFGLEGIGILRNFPKSADQQFKIIAIDERAHAFYRRHKSGRIDAENFALALVPDVRAARDIPLPAAHLSGSERKAAQTLALSELERGCRKFGCTLRHARFELSVELFELTRLAE